MKKNHLLMTMVLATGLLFGACGSKEAAKSEATDSATEMATEHTAEVNTTHAYICPMQCENSASHEPGLCPVCGMDLAKNEHYAGTVAEEPVEEETTMPAEGEKPTE